MFISTGIIFLLLTACWKVFAQSNPSFSTGTGLLFLLSHKAVQNWHYGFDESLLDDDEVEDNKAGPPSITDSTWEHREGYLEYADSLTVDEYGAWWPTDTPDNSISVSENQISNTPVGELLCGCISPALLLETDEQLCTGILNCPETFTYKGIKLTTLGDSQIDHYQCQSCLELAVDNDPKIIETCSQKHVYCGECAKEFEKTNTADSNGGYSCTRCPDKPSGRLCIAGLLKMNFLQEKVLCPYGCGFEGTIQHIVHDHVRVCTVHTPCIFCNQHIDDDVYEEHLKECLQSKKDQGTEVDALWMGIAHLSKKTQIVIRQMDHYAAAEHVSAKSSIVDPPYESEDSINFGDYTFYRTPQVIARDPPRNNPMVYCFSPQKKYPSIPLHSSIVQIEVESPLKEGYYQSAAFVHKGYSFVIAMILYPETGYSGLFFFNARSPLDNNVKWPFNKVVVMSLFAPSKPVVSISASPKEAINKPSETLNYFQTHQKGWGRKQMIRSADVYRYRVNNKYLHICFYFAEDEDEDDDDDNDEAVM